MQTNDQDIARETMKHRNIINFIAFEKMFGIKNLLRFYFKKWTAFNLPISLPVFGTISHREELLSIRDNILKGSLRDGSMERYIRKAGEPVIVDCGINVGVTVRWWLYLNPHTRVYGIDMMQEANDFTVAALPDSFKTRFVPITAVLASSTGQPVDLSYDDPLYGGNNAKISSGCSENRRVNSMTLDDCLKSYRISTIDLLKVDIEDTAAQMFQGATETLLKAKSIMLEVHSEKEREDSIRLLYEKSFRIRRMHKRHIWLDKIVSN